MSLKGAKDQEPIPYQVLLDENRALKDEIQNLRVCLEEADELRRAISERELESKRAEETLAFERSQLLSIFDGMDDVVYVTDPYTYEVLYANRAMKEKFGGELMEGICYREFQRRVSPCDFCTNPIILKERDKPYHWEYYNPTVDRYFMIMDRIIKWPDGRDVRLEIAKDITERKRAEEALRISEERYRSLFNSIDEGFNIIEMIFDDNGKAVDHRILEANPSQEKMTGLKDVVGKRARELLPNFEDYWIESFGQVAITGEPVRLENRIEELDRWFDVYASRFGGEGSRKVAVVFNDITQRKLAEEALHQSEKRLNFALETIHTGAWDLDLVNYDFSHRSLEHDRIFGYEQLLPKWTYEMFLNHVLPEDRAMVDKEFQKAITSGGDWSFECRIRRVDGVIRWIWAAGRHQVDYTGNVRWMAGIVQDITERKRAEETLRETELSCKVAEAVESERQRLFDVLETLPVMIALLTPDHRIAFANRSFREKFGESEGLHCYECCFGSTQPCEFCESYKVLETGQPHHWEVTTPEGSVIDVYNFPFTDVDDSPMILKMDIDITERRKAEEKLRDSEEKYRNIVETANEGILITDDKATITYVNQKLVDMLGYTLENFIGKPIWGFISEEYRPIVKQNLKKRMKGASGSYELKLIRKDGSSLWTFLNAKPLLSKDGNYLGAMSMLTDITERKKKLKNLWQILRLPVRRKFTTE
uniref:PAS domain-containing protein n=1 Tax=Methanosarcina horonobensis TaxID=418008 RepID=UPI000ABC7AA8|nr:PAS domain S-box protein [Methanosarcina horonobensis]